MDDVYVRAPARTRFPTVNVALFLATVVTTVLAGWVMAGMPRAAGVPVLDTAAEIARTGLPFAASLLAILFTHEMGHYVLARRYGVDTSLPYFIPAPIGVGTFGAVIRIRSRLPSLRAVLDIGAAGPIAGFVVAVPLLLWGFAHSTVTPDVDVGVQSPLHWAMGLLRGDAGPAGADREVYVFGDNLLSWAATHLTHPDLPPGMVLDAHPVAIAALFGLLVTALNLFPVGQLDGGHVVYALLGRERARRVSKIVSYGLLALGLTVSWSWLIWWLLTRFVVGYGHPPAVTEEPLTPRRRVFAIASLALFVLTFAPMPIRTVVVP